MADDNVTENGEEEDLMGNIESESGSKDASVPRCGISRPRFLSQVRTCTTILLQFINSLSPSTENIIAFFWAALIFFIGVIFVIAQYTSSLSKFIFVSTYWVLFTFIIIGIIGMSAAIGNRNNLNFIKKSVDDHDEHHEETVSKYLIGNAYVFATGNFLIDLFSIATVFHCSLGTNKDRDKYVNKFIFHSSRIIFTSLQLIFLQIFTGVKIQRKYQLVFKVLVVHLIATNFNIWFTFLCQETGILSGDTEEGTHSGEYNSTCTSTPNDTVYATARYMSEVLQPFILEYSLLAASLLYSICPLNLTISQERSDGRRKYNYGAVDVVQRDDSKIYRSDPGLLVGIFVALLLVISSWSLGDKKHFIYDIRFSYYMQIIMHILIIMCSSIVLYELKTYHNKKPQTRKYKIDDYLLLITGPCGFLPFLITVIFSVSEEISHDKLRRVLKYTGEDILKHTTEIKVLLGLLSSINVISVLLQTYFLLEAHSYDRRRHSSDLLLETEQEEGRKLRSAARIGQWLILLLFVNLAFWVTDSFFELRNDLKRTYSVSSAYWSTNTWNLFAKFLYPIIIFFRFHSVAMIAHIWLHFRVKRKSA